MMKRAILAGILAVICMAGAVGAQQVYTITYHLNGGSQQTDPAPPTEFTVESDSIGLPEWPTKRGYTFDGWYPSAGLLNGARVWGIRTGSTGDRAYWAKWNVIPYTISYHLNGGQIGPGDITIEYTIEKSARLPTGPTRTGYTFAGWYPNMEISGTPVTSISIGTSGDLEFWAEWKPIEYTITYHLNGGSQQTDPEPPAEFTIESDKVELPERPTKRGYAFLGWHSDAGLGGNRVWSMPTGSTGDRTYWAKWEVVPYTITYHLNGGSQQTDPEPPAEFTIETSARLPIGPTRTGYTFAGWYPNEKMLGYPETSIPVGAVGNKEFWAGWKPIEYTITYHLNGGVQAPNAPESYNAITGTTLLSPTRDSGYTFDGWYDNANFIGLRVTSISIGSSGNKTFWAKWAPPAITYYKITYDLNNAVNIVEDGWPIDYSVVDLPLSLPVPAREGYTFGGWLDSNSNRVAVIPAGSTGDMVFRAKWNQVYTITYVTKNDVNIVGQDDWPIYYSVDDLPLSLPVPAREGYIFDGWLDSDSNRVTVISVGSTGDMMFWPGVWTTGIAEAERVIPDNPNSGLSAVVPSVSFAAAFTAGPNAVQKHIGRVNIFRQGKRVEDGTLTVYNSLGGAVNRISIRDNLSAGDLSKRTVGYWDLTNEKGRPAPGGAYLLKGTITAVDGKKEQVSLKVSVR